jgi:hypothetical protein
VEPNNDIPPHSSDMSSAFTVHAVRLWNSIPDAIRRAQSLESFGNLLRGHLLGCKLSYYIL